MTTSTNDSQTSERERLADSLDASAGNPALPKWMHAKCSDAAAQLRAAEAEIAALRAENEALRSVAERIEKAPVSFVLETENGEMRSYYYASAPRELDGHRVRLVREEDT